MDGLSHFWNQGDAVGRAVAVLNGGFARWVADQRPISTTPSPRVARSFTAAPRSAMIVTAAEVPGVTASARLVDARAPERFRGDVEPLDPVAGHIPGALNRPFQGNLGPDGRFKAAEQLRAEYEQLLAGRDPASVVHHCGSGVSAVPNVLAMEVAGLGRTALYAGSWSEWCSDPQRPVERG